MKKFVLLLLMALLLIPCAKVWAEDDDEPAEESYPYVISLYSGDIGDFDETPEKIEVDPGTSVLLSLSGDVLSITVGDGDEKTYTVQIPQETDMDGNPIESKYVALGLKETGNDKSETIVSENISELDEDKSYVISYGIRGTLVNYTVKYVDTEGNQLHAPDTYQGKVGDKMIVAAIPIDGYLPKALNVSKTLSADESENVLKIVYRAVDNTTTEYEYEYEVVPGGGGGGGGGGGETTPAPSGEETPAPEEPIEIDDQDTPQAAPEKPEETKPEEEHVEVEDEKTPLSTYLLIGTGIGMLAIIMFFLLLFFKRRRQQEE